MNRLIVIILLSVITVGCSDAAPLGVDPDGFSLSIIGGDEQAAYVGEELTSPLVVRAVKTFKNKEFPVIGHLVNFVATQGGGKPFAGASLTSGQGTAQDYWTLGNEGCDPTEPCFNRLEVRSVDATTGEKKVFGTFEATALPLVIPICPHAGASDINDSDQVVGKYLNEERFFLWTPDEGCNEISRDYTIFAIRAVNAINAQGTVAGTVRVRVLNPSGSYFYTDHAAIWGEDQSGRHWQDLGDLLEGNDTGYSRAKDINIRGQVVGASQMESGYDEAFIWQNGVMTGLGALEEGHPSVANAINDHGQVVGEDDPYPNPKAVYWTADGGIYDIGAPGDKSYGIDINNSGTVLGYSFFEGGRRQLFLWSEAEGLEVFDPFSEVCGAIPSAINDSGVVVGMLTALDWPSYSGCKGKRSFRWTKEEGFTPLPDLDDAGAVASGINNSGQIVGGPSVSGDAVLWYPKISFFQ